MPVRNVMKWSGPALMAMGFICLWSSLAWADRPLRFEVTYTGISHDSKKDEVTIQATIKSNYDETLWITDLLQNCVCLRAEVDLREIPKYGTFNIHFTVKKKGLKSNIKGLGVFVQFKHADSLMTSLPVPVPDQAYKVLLSEPSNASPSKGENP